MNWSIENLAALYVQFAKIFAAFALGAMANSCCCPEPEPKADPAHDPENSWGVVYQDWVADDMTGDELWIWRESDHSTQLRYANYPQVSLTPNQLIQAIKEYKANHNLTWKPRQ